MSFTGFLRWRGGWRRRSWCCRGWGEKTKVAKQKNVRTTAISPRRHNATATLRWIYNSFLGRKEWERGGVGREGGGDGECLWSEWGGALTWGSPASQNRQKPPISRRLRAVRRGRRRGSFCELNLLSTNILNNFKMSLHELWFLSLLGPKTGPKSKKICFPLKEKPVKSFWSSN